mmetsp:Transcript_44591/g.120115  ORF Transcript_44591/g.120115 Transcript_44591/m.120115 type:complete len:371 (+) Transcript_44591:625-1737(+)
MPLLLRVPSRFFDQAAVNPVRGADPPSGPAHVGEADRVGVEEGALAPAAVLDHLFRLLVVELRHDRRAECGGHVEPDLVHAALGDLARAEREVVHPAVLLCLRVVGQDLHVRPRALPVHVQPGLLPHGLQVPVDCLLLRLDDAMDEADVQLPDVVAVEALAHLLPRQLREADEHRATGLTVQAVAKAIVLVLIEEVRVGLVVQVVHQLDPPVDVLLLAVGELVLQEVVEDLVALVLDLLVGIQRPALLLVHVARRADPIRWLVNHQHVLPAPDERGEHDLDARLRAHPLRHLQVARDLLLLRVQRAAAEHGGEEASLGELDGVIGADLHTVGLGVLPVCHVEGVELRAAVALHLFVGQGANGNLHVFVRL